jgi:HK97 gp10 family phage protein
MNVSYEIEGVDNAAKAIDDRVVTPVKAGLLDALLEAGKVFTEGCQEHAPVKTGWLRDHIHEDEVSENEVVVKPHDTPYAIYQELGTYKMAPKMYMRFGYETRKDEALDAINKKLASIIGV